MKLHDIVAALQDFPERNVIKGQVGTVIEKLDASNVLVEFVDTAGVTYAISPIPVTLLLELKHMPTGSAELDEQKTPLERLAEHGDTVLKVVAVLFAIAVVFLLVSLKLKFG